MHAELGAGDHQRVAHVVPVTEVRDAHAFEGLEALADRHHVRERLARVELVGEPVDDRDVRVRRQLVDVRLLEGPDHDAVEVARQDPRGVFDRLSASQLEVAGGQVEAAAAELRDPDLEADPRPRRGLLEDHPERAAGEIVMLDPLLLARLQPVGDLEKRQEVGRLPVVHPQEVVPLQMGRNHACILASSLT
jgi:hypothetical protein